MKEKEITKIKNFMNYEDFDRDNEKDFEPSQTIPDQTMSIRELVRRYASGLPLGGSKESIYEGEDGDGVDPRRLDLAERQELEIAARQELEEIEKRLKSTRITTEQKLSKKDIEDIQSQDVEHLD
jgi:hypothetical protein